MSAMLALKTLEWIGDARSGFLRLLDQTRLPTEVTYLDCHDVQSVWDAIKRLSVRGAPAIGVAAAYGCVIGSQHGNLVSAADHLAASRPTAVNLFWAVDRMKRAAAQPGTTPESLLAEAKLIHHEDVEMCKRIGGYGLPLIKELSGRLKNASAVPGVLTHCNAGALATAGIGTATAPMYLAKQAGIPFAVFADETRPLLQGARLTAFELQAADIDVTLICDDMAAHTMRNGRIQMVITGADRIAANGDAANKIGTYNLAVLAHHHSIPFYVAAPTSTFDLATPDGSHIPIEERAAEEITEGFGKRTAPIGIKTFSPAFDVTPSELITALITDRGLIQPVNTQNVARVLTLRG